MATYKDDPREIIVRFPTICAETGKPIKAGEVGIWYPRTKKMFAIGTKAEKDFRSWQADCANGFEY